MKKIALTIAIVLGISFSSIAQEMGGGLFQYGAPVEEESTNYFFSYNREGGLIVPGLPGSFGSDDNQSAPLGSGTLLLIGMGAAYAAAKRRKE